MHITFFCFKIIADFYMNRHSKKFLHAMQEALHITDAVSKVDEWTVNCNCNYGNY